MANVTFIEYNYCSIDYYNEGGKCTVKLFDGSTVGLPKRCQKYVKYDNCTDSAKLNLTTQDYSYLMALSGLTVSFIFAFLVSLIITFVSRK